MAYGPFNTGGSAPAGKGGTASDVSYDNTTSKLQAENTQDAIDELVEKIKNLAQTIDAVPSQNGSLTYTGNAQSPSWNSYNPDMLEIGGVTSGTDAGTYTATFTPKEGYQWSDGTTDAKEVTWTIGRASITTIPTQSGTLTYSGAAQSPSWSGYDADKMTLGGVISGTNAGSYNATFTPTANYQWSDGTTAAKTVAWSIGRAAIAATPAQSGSLTYSGSAQTPSWSNYDSTQLTIGGTTSGTNAGSYDATFTPTSNYAWSDGSTTAKTVAWTIAKAEGSLSLSLTSLSLPEDSLTGDVDVTRAGDGAVSASSSNTSVAAVNVSGTKITVTGKANGSATITVNVAAGTNHTAPSSKTFTVKVSILSASTSATSGVTYISGISGITQADLNRYAKAISNNSAITNETSTVYIDDGDNHYKISVGDTVTISVSGASYSVCIIGFNHDDLTNSTAYGTATATGKAGFSFQMVDCLATIYTMNSSNTNSGGWDSCALCTTLQSTIKNTIAAAWTGIMKNVNKKTSAGSQSKTINTTSDDLFLLSEIEIFGSTTNSAPGEGSQYAYYKAGNSKIKTVNGSANSWWERSPYVNNTLSFCFVFNGDASASDASRSWGVAFGFCV